MTFHWRCLLGVQLELHKSDLSRKAGSRDTKLSWVKVRLGQSRERDHALISFVYSLTAFLPLHKFMSFLFLNKSIEFKNN